MYQLLKFNRIYGFTGNFTDYSTKQKHFSQRCTLEYRINGGGGGGENNQEGGWKWFDVTIIRGAGIIGGCLEK